MTVQLKKSESQHILVNNNLIDVIIDKAKIKHTDIVLEIGAGTGNITMKLLPKTKKVIAYEKDKKLANEIQNKLYTQKLLKAKLHLIQDNVLENNLPHFDKCISNIPFNISLPIILKLMNSHFKNAFILVQKEFADRLTSRPGSKDYSRLSVIVQLFAKVECVLKVKKNNFIPQPKVDTCFIKIEPKVPRPSLDLTEFDNLLKICFSRKNKTLMSNLKTPQMKKYIENSINCTNFDNQITSILDKLNYKNERPIKMSIEKYVSLFLEFKNQGIHFN